MLFRGAPIGRVEKIGLLLAAEAVTIGVQLGLALPNTSFVRLVVSVVLAVMVWTTAWLIHGKGQKP